MKKEIIYSEAMPDKRFLWLHYKNDNLVLEAFGKNGWELVGDEKQLEALITSKLEEAKNAATKEPVKVKLRKLTEECSKAELISTVEELKKALVKAGIIKL